MGLEPPAVCWHARPVVVWRGVHVEGRASLACVTRERIEGNASPHIPPPPSIAPPLLFHSIPTAPLFSRSLSSFFQQSSNSRRGSSTTSFTRFRKVTASRPSIRRWSYVSAMFIIGRASMPPPATTTGRWTIECMPRMAD